MKMIDIEYCDKVALIKLTRGTTNALNLELLNELSKALKKVIQDTTVHGLVLTSSNEKFFCIGYDLRELYTLSEKDFTTFYQTFNRVCLDLYAVPKPTVAAITGHAIAGGCALTLCCDYRYIAEGRKLMGFNVMRLGIPVPYFVNCVLTDTVGTRIARTITDSGEFYSPEQLLAMGMVDSVAPIEEVIPKSLEKAHLLGALPQKAFAITKSNRVEKVKAQVSAHLAEKERKFVECWFSDEARELLKEAMEKF